MAINFKEQWHGLCWELSIPASHAFCSLQDELHMGEYRTNETNLAQCWGVIPPQHHYSKQGNKPSSSWKSSVLLCWWCKQHSLVAVSQEKAEIASFFTSP